MILGNSRMGSSMYCVTRYRTVGISVDVGTRFRV